MNMTLSNVKNVVFPYLDLILSLIKRNKHEIERRKLFYAKFIRKDNLVFDIGANMGNRTGPLVEIGAKVVGVEPQQRCFRYLQLKFGKKIDLVKKGVSSKVETKTLFMAKAHVVSTFSTDWIESVKESGRFKGVDWNRKVDIEMTTLDELIKMYGVPKFIKIDVEGYELEVLKGLSQPVEYLSFEYAVPENIDDLIHCLGILNKLYDQAEYNYSVGESMEWRSENWMSYQDICKLVLTGEFSETRFGDIYIRRN